MNQCTAAVVTDDTHNRVDAPQGNSEHGIEIRARGKTRCNDSTRARNRSKKTRLDGTKSESVDHIIRPSETSSCTRKKND